MKQTIYILDQHSANQIAAGEVVEKPASVVKELVENALDAGAKHINISIEGSGVELIRVRDDGCGIEPEDLPRSVLRHATSKIRCIEDLNTLTTLGFRGEALPSIASVSRMEIVSRSQEKEAGMLLRIEAGKQTELCITGSPPGTTVSVRDLFYNTPARRKFLRTQNTEFGHISDIICRIALARPDVAFTLTRSHKVILHTSGRNDLRETAGAVFGLDIARKLIPIDCYHNDWRLQGYLGPADMLRSNKQGEIFSVNGRTIRSLLLSRALLDGYHTLIQAKHYPYAILNLQIPPDEYDVNVHPTKLEIRFRKEKEIAEFISANVAASVIKGMKESYFSLSGPYAEYDAGKKDNIVLGGRTYSYRQVINIDKDLGHIYGKKTTVSEESNVSAKEDSAIEYVTETAAILANNSEYIQNTAIATGAILEKDEAFFLDNIWPLAQVLQTYILATDGKELIIIDQHAVHERINYELIWERANNSLKISQELLIPVALELSLQEEQILLEHLSVLLDMGFVIEHFGARDYRLRAVPAYTGSLPAEELLHQFLDNVLNTNQIITLEKMVEKWIYILACHQSMKAKQSLSLLEMEQLIEKLRQTKNPFTCPHGRPTMIRFSKSDLEKKFYRA